MKTILHTIPKGIFSYDFPQPVAQIGFFDIETTGLSPRASSLYLIGFMYYNPQICSWELCQWFANDYNSEKEMLLAFLTTLENYSYLYHFNGTTFDIPYLLHKIKKQEISLSEHNRKILSDTTGTYSIDLLKRIRSLKSFFHLNKCNQTSVENYLGIHRKDTYSGGELIPVYSQYMQKKILDPSHSSELEEILLLHNHDDIAMMKEISSLLVYYDLLFPAEDKDNSVLNDQSISQGKITLENSLLTLTFSLSSPLPCNLERTLDFSAYVSTQQAQVLPSGFSPKLSLSCNEQDITLKIPVYQGTLKYFMSPCQDYYYLPKEDMAIHKSVAQFVDSSYRKKATASTCYTKKEGTFLPDCSFLLPAKKKVSLQDLLPNLANTPAFYREYKEKLCFYLLPDSFENQLSFWKEYAMAQLWAFPFSKEEMADK